MKIYEIWQNEVKGWDTYDSCVIIAEGINQAKRLSIDALTSGGMSDAWTTDIHQVHAKEIGTTNETEPRIVVASFNAG